MSLQGQLLVASPALLDPNFARTVVLVTQHSEEGAMGIVLNRPSLTDVVDAVPQLVGLLEGDERVYVGGPVEPAAVVVLAEFDDPDSSPVSVFADVGFLRADADPDELAVTTRRARAFAGYAGWEAGQLEAELEEPAWIVEPARPDDVFAADPDELWADVLRRKGGQYALLARMPLDPSVN